MWIELAIFGLATWRVSSLFVNESGPFHLFRKIRELTGIEHDASGVVTIIPDGFWSSLLTCVWCASLWVGLGWVVLDWMLPVVALKLATAFSFSAVAIGIQKWMERDR